MRTRTRRRLVLVLPLVFCAAMAWGDEPADRAALEAASQAWAAAFNARDADGMAALATPDVVSMEANAAPAAGRDAVRVAWLQAACTARSKLTIATKEIVVAGGIAWKISAATHTQSGGAVVGRGYLLEIWQKVDGRWEIHRQLSSVELAGRPGLQPRPVPSEPVLDKPVD
jgi:ketosteroid isomerase-like protein